MYLVVSTAQHELWLGQIRKSRYSCSPISCLSFKLYSFPKLARNTPRTEPRTSSGWMNAQVLRDAGGAQCAHPETAAEGSAAVPGFGPKYSDDGYLLSRDVWVNPRIRWGKMRFIYFSGFLSKSKCWPRF